ncbi:hypothetical protein BH24BAC1_BH24BAC1_03740 [soil metagenome]|jgi:hypothetical protein
MKKLFFVLAGLSLIFLQLSVSAQGVLVVEKETHDFGNIAEGTQATHEFKLKNTGDQPVVISNVQASCGCTTPAWTKDPILPGKSGMVKAVYNSEGRPGSFNKSITVTSNAATPSMLLFIKGVVVSKSDAKTSLTPADLENSPRLALNKATHDFGKLEKGQKAVAKISFKNNGKSDLVIEGVQTACNCVSLNSAPKAIKPGEQGTLELTYTPRALNDRAESVKIVSNDVAAESKVTLKAKVVESLAAQNMLKEGTTAVPFK